LISFWLFASGADGSSSLLNIKIFEILLPEVSMEVQVGLTVGFHGQLNELFVDL